MEAQAGPARRGDERKSDIAPLRDEKLIKRSPELGLGRYFVSGFAGASGSDCVAAFNQLNNKVTEVSYRLCAKTVELLV